MFDGIGANSGRSGKSKYVYESKMFRVDIASRKVETRIVRGLGMLSAQARHGSRVPRRKIHNVHELSGCLASKAKRLPRSRLSGSG